MGADIAVSYTAMHPGKIGGIVIVDGAGPVQKPLIENVADICVEVDAHRSKLMDLYRKVDCPITMLTASKPQGEKDPYNRRSNRLWQDGVDQLTKAIPSISVQWINDSHQLPFKHPVDIARRIDEFDNRQASSDSSFN